MADGTIRDVEVSPSKILFNGRTMLHSIIIDVTDRKEAEDKLKESELRFAVAVEGTAAGTLFAEKVTAIFIDDIPKQINALKQALLAQDSKMPSFTPIA